MAKVTVKMRMLAKKLGINPTDMTYEQLSSAIDAAPAFPDQVVAVTALMRAIGQPAPKRLTYRDAKTAIDQVGPLVNLRIIERERWQVETILDRGKDGYWIIVEIHDDNRVSLDAVTITKVGRRHEITPRNLMREIHDPYMLSPDAKKLHF